MFQCQANEVGYFCRFNDYFSETETFFEKSNSCIIYIYYRFSKIIFLNTLQIYEKLHLIKQTNKQTNK